MAKNLQKMEDTELIMVALAELLSADIYNHFYQSPYDIHAVIKELTRRTQRGIRIERGCDLFDAGK